MLSFQCGDYSKTLRDRHPVMVVLSVNYIQNTISITPLTGFSNWKLSEDVFVSAPEGYLIVL